jgi:hypothetical protein
MPVYERKVIGDLLKSRFRVDQSDETFDDLLKKLEKVPAKKG